MVLAQRFDFDLGADPFDVYRVLRQVEPEPVHVLRAPTGLTIVGLARPSRWCSCSTAGDLPPDRRHPVPGTTDEDRRLAAELAEHPRSVAEHIMLVDLARNDVGGWSARHRPGRRDDDPRAVQPRHAASRRCRVTLAEGAGRRSTCCGRAAGGHGLRPKVRAMEIIDALEPVKRGPYAGVVGYLDFSGNIDTAIAIRTMLIDRRAR